MFYGNIHLLLNGNPKKTKKCQSNTTKVIDSKVKLKLKVIQNALSVAIRKIRLNAEITFYIAAKTWFGQLKNLSNVAVSSRISHILNHKPYIGL